MLVAKKVFVPLMIAPVFWYTLSWYFRSRHRDELLSDLYPNTEPAEPRHTLRYFVFSEFDSPDEPGSGLKMSPELLKILDEARARMAAPLRINSGYRTTSHNTRVGGATRSAHLRGLAADIHCPDVDFQRRLSVILSDLGVTRMGFYKTSRSYFLHADIDDTKGYQGTWRRGF